MANETKPQPRRCADYWYDYQVQAWVLNERYESCAHPGGMVAGAPCGCYGLAHAGELAPPEHRES